MLVLYADDIKSRVKNFNEDVINKIKTNWERIRKSILNAFEMFYRLGFENRTFPAKMLLYQLFIISMKTNLRMKL